MPIQLNSPVWRIRSATRGGAAAGSELPGLPPEFLTDESRVAEEVVLDPAGTTRGQAGPAGPIDLTCDVEPGQAAVRRYRPPILLTSIAHTPRPCVAMTSMRSRGCTMKSITLTDGRLPPRTSHRAPPFVVTYTPKSFDA